MQTNLKQILRRLNIHCLYTLYSGYSGYYMYGISNNKLIKQSYKSRQDVLKHFKTNSLKKINS